MPFGNRSHCLHSSLRNYSPPGYICTAASNRKTFKHRDNALKPGGPHTRLFIGVRLRYEVKLKCKGLWSRGFWLVPDQPAIVLQRCPAHRRPQRKEESFLGRGTCLKA